ncbi:MAG: Asp-tRNA(Asn)/Glu-tRNA(Gln) amidotransferase subunit GatA [Candidatus Omnitrophica bacterium]|nr:Asp-tRNA(Asn)/Glu-tRNA(Gln) amidotransferase subunit GatA [Candidatus Omnitrophota bacterium]
MKLSELTAHQLKESYKKGGTSPTEVCKALFTAVDRLDPIIHAFVYLDREKILARAKELEQRPYERPLWGIPVAIKDILCVEGEPTTCASKILEGFCPPYNATVIEYLKAAGAILFGKTNMDEFAFGSSTETSCYGPTKNPWHVDRIPGGSSGGSCACVSAGQVPLSLGSDTGGSIRQPASMCGVVGLKPTYGRVSRYGLIAFASSLDQVGPIARDIPDCALLAEIISRHDPRDATSVAIETPPYSALLQKDITGLTLGVPREYFAEGIHADVGGALQDALKTLKGLGAKTVSISLPHTKYAVADYYIVAPAEASSNLARFDGVQYGYRSQTAPYSAEHGPLIDMYLNTRREGFGAEAKRRIMLGTHALSSGYYEAYYLRALKVRSLIRGDFDEAFKKCDCIITPTSPTTAFGIGERLADPLSMYLSDILTISANLSGIPGISLPCGFDPQGLPIGLQILARPFDEQLIFNVGYAFQCATDFHTKRPGLAAGKDA